jgi:hypothetical protein
MNEEVHETEHEKEAQFAEDFVQGFCRQRKEINSEKKFESKLTRWTKARGRQGGGPA